MKKISLLAIVAVLILAGCVTTRQHTVDLNDPYAEFGLNATLGPYAKIQAQNLSRQKVSLNDVNQRARRLDAYVTLADFRVVKARNLQVTPDSTSWFKAETGLFECVATTEVQQILFIRLRNPKRMVVGMLAGTAVGAAVGAALGYAAGDTPPSECCGIFCDGGSIFCTAKERATFNAVLFGVIGGITGGAIGGFRSTVNYRFKAPPHTPPAVVADVNLQFPKRP